MNKHEQELLRIGAEIELPKALERVAVLQKILGDTTPRPAKAELPVKAKGWTLAKRRKARLRINRMWEAARRAGRNKLTKMDKLKKTA